MPPGSLQRWTPSCRTDSSAQHLAGRFPGQPGRQHSLDARGTAMWVCSPAMIGEQRLKTGGRHWLHENGMMECAFPVFVIWLA